MVDGYLCGVLLQPERVASARWMKHVIDADGRAAPASFDSTRLRALVERRHAELEFAIGNRKWFDPWVFELSAASETVRVAQGNALSGPTHNALTNVSGRSPDGRIDREHGDCEANDNDNDSNNDGDAADAAAVSEAVYPWVAGFAAAMEFFPALMQVHGQASAVVEPLALLYRHLDPDDLEDAEELFAEIDALEPAVNLADAVEALVRATLLIAEVSRPVR